MRIEFRDGRIDSGDGRTLERAMAAEVRVIYEGLALDGDDMPAAGPAELNPPAGRFIVGYDAGRAVCCGGIKRLAEGICELKRMYVVPDARGRGVARALLVELEDRARALGYAVARIDTGPRQSAARHLYESAGYAPIANFNANPIATFWGEKRLT
ncbi:MAG: GNAT family N-acetyltransferase [Conexibacteraceae bacterium]|nr:GNAT family N-acetyltransferase [Conexibacteraceae bacterium]